MLDPKLFREDITTTAKQLKKRGYQLDIEQVQELENHRKQIQVATQTLQNERNTRSKSIGKAKANGEDIQPLLKEVSELGEKLNEHEAKLTDIQQQLQTFYYGIPNLLFDEVPIGKNEDDNIEIRRWGEPTKFDFKPLDHVDLGAKLGMNFNLGSKIAGSRFVVLQGKLAKLQRALTQFMLDLHTKKHGYTECYVPYLVNQESLYGTGQLPKFVEDQFHIKDWPYSLIPTAEVPLTNIVRNEIIRADQMPMKLTAHTPCFRSEAGSYGKDTRGMIRQHQFEKVELVQIVDPKKSEAALEELTSHAEAVLQALELPYRVMLLCSGDTGFCSAKTYDLEVWLPGQQQYREISSCSLFKDFQARRLQARWRNPDTDKPEYVHTLNGSGLAVGRTLVAILENYQDKDGHIQLPNALENYLDELTI